MNVVFSREIEVQLKHSIAGIGGGGDMAKSRNEYAIVAGHTFLEIVERMQKGINARIVERMNGGYSRFWRFNPMASLT